MTALLFNNISTSSVKMNASANMNNVMAKRTLRSIKRYSPQMAANAPLTLHSVEQDLFPRLWSLWAEVMLVEGSLSPTTKQAIAGLVKEHNSGSSSLVINSSKPKRLLASTSDPFEAATHTEALKHGHSLIHGDFQLDSNSNSSHFSHGSSVASSGSQFSRSSSRHLSLSNLTKGAKAETALVVLVTSHLDRVEKALTSSSSMRRCASSPVVSNSGSMPKTKSSSMLNRLKTQLKSKSEPPHKAGFTAPLFLKKTPKAFGLPEHLQGAAYAGGECIQALGRLVAWVENYQEQLICQGLVTLELLDRLEYHLEVSPCSNPVDPEVWVSLLGGNLDLTRVLLLTSSRRPQRVSKSRAWHSLVQAVGKDQATSLVLWWSLRLSLDQARGLRSSRLSFSCSSQDLYSQRS